MSKKILIIQTAFIGDALLSIPLLRNLRQNNPDSEITYLCRSGMGDFLTRLGFTDHVIELDKSQYKNFFEIKKKLQSEKWDWIICPHESIRSIFLSHGLSAPRKTSYKNTLTLFTFNERIERPMDLPEALRTLSLLQNSQPELKIAFDEYRKKTDHLREINFNMTKEMMNEFGLKRPSHQNIVRVFRQIPVELSMEISHFSDLRTARKNPALAIEKVKMILSQSAGRKIFVIAPGSVWETKMWRSEYVREVCEELALKHFVILIGGPSERKLCSDLATGLTNIYNAAGETTLWESAELLACSDQVLTNDSGTMHLASLSSANVLSVFGPTSIEQGYRPWNNEARTIESAIYCRPCGRHGAKKCPLGNHACMKLVAPEHVLDLFGEGAATHANPKRNPSH